MLADPEGREILRAKPVINEATVDLAALAVSLCDRTASRDVDITYTATILSNLIPS